MNKRLITALLVVGFFHACLISVSYAQFNVYEYDGAQTRRISDANSNNWGAQINENNDIVYQGFDGNDWEIFLYKSSTGATIQITNNNFDDKLPELVLGGGRAINSNGQIVWTGEWYLSDGKPQTEIFLYDGSQVAQLSSGSGRSPEINANGQVVWVGEGAIMLYDGVTINQLSNGLYDDDRPRINSNGDVVWEDFLGTALNNEIFRYDSSAGITTRLTNNSNSDFNPEINDLGQIVWEGWVDQDPNNREVFFYNGLEILQLTNDTAPEQRSTINNSGLVAWEAPHYPPDGDFELFSYDTFWGITSRLTNNGFNDAYLQINDFGQVAWSGGGGLSPYFELFLFDGLTTSQITDNGWRNIYPDINNNSHVVWVSDFDESGALGANSIPEPATALLFGAGIAGVFQRKRNNGASGAVNVT